MSFPKTQESQNQNPLLQQQKLDFKTTAFVIKNTPYPEKKQPTHFKQKRNHITE